MLLPELSEGCLGGTCLQRAAFPRRMSVKTEKCFEGPGAWVLHWPSRWPSPLSTLVTNVLCKLHAEHCAVLNAVRLSDPACYDSYWWVGGKYTLKWGFTIQIWRKEMDATMNSCSWICCSGDFSINQIGVLSIALCIGLSEWLLCRQENLSLSLLVMMSGIMLDRNGLTCYLS